MWATTKAACETISEQLNRLEREREEIDRRIAFLREEAKPNKTRGEEIATKEWWPLYVAKAIDAEIARAKAEQKEADAKIVERSGCEFCAITAKSIRNQK